MRKLNLRQLRSLIAEELLTFKKNINEDAQPNPDKQATGTSIDSQIDKFLMSYEREAKTVKTEGNDIFRTYQKLMFLEANEEDDDASKEEKSSDEDTDSMKLSLDDIDVEAFADNVARLIENFTNLLEIERTVIRRSINFMLKSYDGDVISAYKKALRNLSMSADKSDFEHEDEDFVPPNSGLAGPLGG